MLETIVGFAGMGLPLVFYFLHPVSKIESEYWDRHSKAIKLLTNNGL